MGMTVATADCFVVLWLVQRIASYFEARNSVNKTSTSHEIPMPTSL